MACQICHNLLPLTLEGLAQGKRATFFVTAGDLLESVESGFCAECTVLHDAIGLFKDSWSPEEVTRVIEIRVSRDQPLELFYRPETLYLDLFRDALLQDCEQAPETIGEIHLASEQSASAESTDLVREWLRDCQTTHGLCQPVAKARSLPTRVLDIGDEQQVVLRNTQDLLDQEGAYVALSYCWGKPPANQALLTTKATLEQHCKGIVISALPPTILDAVKLSRSLGFRFIWVDALCIVQDDSADWEREAAKMSDVYFNASLTIVASRASGTAVGMFGHQEYHDSQTIPYRSGIVRVRRCLAREHGSIVSLDREPINHEPINKRAWCLQEAILSNRAVYYTKQEIHWICNEWRKCECGGLTARILPEDLAEYQSLRIEELFQAQTQEEAYIRWDDVVGTFSQRSLTYDTDRLPALSGLAKRFADLTRQFRGQDDAYLAGIWQGSIPRALLWRVSNETTRASRDGDMHHRRAAVWRAPSWSWASLEASVTTPPLSGMTSLIELIRSCTVPAVLDHFGQLKAAFLSIRGIVLHQVIARPTSRVVFGNRQWGLWQDVTSIGTFVPDFEDFCNGDQQEATCSVLLLGHRKMMAMISAMVLLPADLEQQTYRRIGVADLGPFKSRFQQTASHNNAMPSIPEGSLLHVDSLTAEDFIQQAPSQEIVLV